MGTRVIASALVALVVLAPWIVWLPFVRAPVAVIAFGAIALSAAFHGWGRLVARIARCEAGALLAMWWGVAAMTALGGLAIALHLYDPRLLVISGGIAHGLDISLRFDSASAGIAARLKWSELRWWLLPSALIALVAVMHVLGWAGEVTARPFDDDGNVIAQARRLLDTGALADPIGYARTSQLGGHVALAGLVGAFAEARALRVLDSGLAFVLVLGLVVTQIRPRDTVTALWSCVVVIALSAFGIHWPELAPLWLVIGVLVAACLTFDLGGAGVALGLLAGAACALRVELAPFAIVLVAGAWWRGERSWRAALVLAAPLVAMVLAFAAARWSARSAVDAVARALLESSSGGTVGHLALFVVASVALAPVIVVFTRELPSPRARWWSIACAAAIAAIATKLVGVGTFATHYVLVVIIAMVLVLAIEVVARTPPPRLALVLGVLACVIVVEAGFAPGRTGWWPRYRALAFDVAYLRASAPEPAPYDTVLAVPPGDTVAVWVTQPETLDYAKHRIVDLRTPRAAKLRVDGPDDMRMEQLIRASHARWLLLETDDAFVERGERSFLYRMLCARSYASCADSLEAIAFRHRVVLERDGVKLIAIE